MNIEIKFHSVLAERLQKECDKKGWGVKEFTKAYNAYNPATKERTVRYWLSGDSKPDIDTLEEICLLFGCTPDYLLGYNDCSAPELQFISNETGLNENSINSLKYRLKRANDNNDFAHDLERNNIDSFNQVLSRIDLLGFCSKLLSLAKEKSNIADSQKFWDEYNSALEKGKKPHRKPKNVMPYLECDAQQHQQRVKEYDLQEHLSSMIRLLSESLSEFPIKK